MAALKGGTLSDFAGSMAESIEKALEKEWQADKGSALPADGKDERRILLAAIASGILNYLEAHQDEFINKITLQSGSTTTDNTVTKLDLNIQS
ncbi:MAG TPA: hypothetical protein VMC09_11505 [Anaerolineales bacterium]|nr:hypothetical protein [Anaerolineales bacterium]